MAKNFRQQGNSLTITGITSQTIAAGSLYRRTGTGQSGDARAWIGCVEDEILGTSVANTTVDGRPIQIGDGVAAEAQFGTGKGDMTIEGVFTFRLPYSGALVLDADPLYAQFTSNVASGVTDNMTSGGVQFGAISGSLVGFAVGGNYISTVAPFVGMNVVDVKLIGLPLHGLAAAAPSS